LLLGIGDKARNDNYLHLGIDAKQGADNGNSTHNRHHHIGDNGRDLGLSMNVKWKDLSVHRWRSPRDTRKFGEFSAMVRRIVASSSMT
jgi:hypothetical protein